MLNLKNGWLVLIQAEPIDNLFCVYPNDRVQIGHVGRRTNRHMDATT